MNILRKLEVDDTSISAKIPVKYGLIYSGSYEQ